jgi:transcriptional regulator with XRE-family HTH domain
VLSAYEREVREPTLLTLLKYAQAAGIYMDTLIDASVDLPEKNTVYAKSLLPEFHRKLLERTKKTMQKFE